MMPGPGWVSRAVSSSCAKSILDYNISAILELQQEFSVAQTWRADWLAGPTEYLCFKKTKG